MEVITHDLGLRRYKIVVSDFHLGKGRFYRDGTQNILEDFLYDEEFGEFLKYYQQGDYLDAEVELVLNGDILNMIQLDYYGVHSHLLTERSVCHGLKKIIAGHPSFFESIRDFASTPRHSVAYVIGNHDIGMLWEKPKEMLSEAIGARIKYHHIRYEFEGIRIEHGQQYESFVKTDMVKPWVTKGLPEPVMNLPWGSLFVAVLHPKLKQSRPHIDKVKPFAAFLRHVLIHDFFWAMRSAVLVAKFGLDTFLFRRRYQIRSGVRNTFYLLKEITVYPTFSRFARELFKNHPNTHTILFGHTHVLEYKRFPEGREYFNIGTWNEATNLELTEFGSQTRLTYGYIELPQNGRPRTRLKVWKGIWKAEMDIGA